MSSIALFAVGFAVSVLVFAALGLLVLGAILDGRDEQAHKDTEAAGAASVTPLRPPAPVIPIPSTEGEVA